MGGFDFDTLVERKPALREELLTLRDHLLAADEEEEAVKVGPGLRHVKAKGRGALGACKRGG